MKSKSRNAHMELLRVIAMLMIIAHHLVYYSSLLNIDSGLNRHFAQLLNIGGKLGVNLFVMIGAWHMSAKEYSLRRTVKLWLQTAATGLLILILYGSVRGWNYIGSVPNAFLQMLLPVSQTGYWFAGTYIILTVLMPFLNVILRLVGRKGLDVLLGVMTFSMSIIPSVFIGKTTYFSPIFWFVYLYLLIGRLRRWKVPALAKHGMKLFAINIVLIFAGSLILEGVHAENASLIHDVNYYANRMEVLPMLAASLGLFMAFVKKRPYENKVIEWMGGCCFGVYLIHDHPYLRSYIWGNIVKAGAFAQSPRLMLYVPIAVMLVFAGAVLIESVRRLTLGRAEERILALMSALIKRFDGMLKREMPNIYTKSE